MNKRSNGRRTKPAASRTAPVLPVRDNVHFPHLINTLLVGRDVSVRALQSAMRKDRHVLVVGQTDVGVDEPRASDLFRAGTLSEVMQVLPMPDGTMRVVLRGISRAIVDSYAFRGGYFVANVTLVPEPLVRGADVEALRREGMDAFLQIADLGKPVPQESLDLLPAIEGPGELADFISNHLNLRPEVKQGLLEDYDPVSRLSRLVKLLIGERQVLELQSDIRSKVEEELGNTQREYYLREQLRAIQHELSGTDESEEGIEYRRRIEASGMPPETREKALQELRRFERAPASSPEGMVVRNYLDWLTALPWARLSADRLDVRAAAKILDRDHYGLTQVKDRILDFLAVRQLSQSLRGPILCFVGPPGVGKTSIGRSIAEALGRQFVRVSLGGVRDEAEVRGHRRTYIGSMPGRLIQGIKSCGTRNPVFMLDEIDKMSIDLRGDPTSALLEALDPEQNEHFSDHYIEAPFDLSAVMFIMTANLLENIPVPLRDRMEMIRFPSYTEAEKLQIASEFLLPKKIAEHGLRPGQMSLDTPELQSVVRDYTREAGIRALEREIATLCRKTARRIAEKKARRVAIDMPTLREMLGKPRFRFGNRGDQDEVGAATGLVFTEFGGDLVTIEVSLMSALGDQPQLRMTGSLGDIMKESAQAAVTYVRSKERNFSPERPFHFDVHVHVPEGAVPKDGPSAGITIATALVSAFIGAPVRREVAMTGEITLRGKVLPVGGVREKVLAAHRAGILHVVLPEENLADLDELPDSVRRDIEFHAVTDIGQVLDIALVRATAGSISM
ncbi:MAG TPA: endopeptidase La [Fimbriimonadaceae bacterium]|nr:endopeptidase La [Fimbriimonadaceae bacterium]HRJ95463.1 endopeptidase La [Fimbriimonadaceae bacterium]